MEIVFFSETVGSLKSDDDRFMQVFFCLRHHGLIGFNRYPVVAVGLVRMEPGFFIMTHFRHLIPDF